MAALLAITIAMAAAGERLADPTRAFTEGYDPSGNDFLANVPERAVLRRIRADFDNDGVDDLALSDSSTWGNAGGQWLLFRGQPDQSYVYWRTLFFHPGAAVLQPQAAGTSEMALYVRRSVSPVPLRLMLNPPRDPRSLRVTVTRTVPPMGTA